MKKYNEDLFNFYFVELSGRGRRVHEQLYDSFSEAVNDIYEQVQELIRMGPYVILGHSMGSWLAYELYYKIIEEKAPLPIHIFFSGNRSPYTKQELSVMNLNDEEFIDYIIKNHEATKKIFEVKKLRKLFLPILRSDYKIMEEYQPSLKKEKIKVSISTLGGGADPLLSKGFYDWGELTEQDFTNKIYDGKHFYIFENFKEVSDFMKETLLQQK
ncbi:thioesterase II family protein [Streptococcus sanguinis]|uniref:thioesterase II family protein n=1 Tax=Streptococcus sanguinis TaxID=1305 RepID=UPI001F24416C|nr:thioesterase domain-containing protein [Streptococcus sanguinis]